MKNTSTLTKTIQKYVFINLVLMMLSVAVAWAQNAETCAMSGDDTVYELKKELCEQINGAVNEKKEDILPVLGPELNKLAKRMFDFLTNDASSNLNAGFTDGEIIQGLSLTSSYINNQLLGGMKLEFYANPVKGGGALIFKKTF